MEDKLRTHLYSYGLISNFEFKNYDIIDTKDSILYDDKKGYFLKTINVTGDNVGSRIINLGFIIYENFYPKSQFYFDNPVYFGIDDKNNKIYYFEKETKPKPKGDYIVRH